MGKDNKVQHAQDWSALDDVSIDEQMQSQEDFKEQQLQVEQQLMYEMVKAHPAAIRHLKNRFMDTAMAVQGDDLLTIGIRQGQSNMIKWIINKAEQNL